MSIHAALRPQDATVLALPAPASRPKLADFNPLEWSIIRLSRGDRLWTIRPLGALRRFINWLTNTGSLELANERLEALRKAAVLSWHFGYAVPGRAVSDFVAAGFSTDQYELMVNSISSAKRSRNFQ